jgi:plasmid stabilization system protein ParE
MALEIVWTSGAERDLLEIYQWLFESFSDDARLIDQALRVPLDSAVGLLQHHPEAGASVRGSKGFRRWLLGPQRRYGLFYVVEKRGLIIHALIDLRQDPSAIWKRLHGSIKADGSPEIS